jgi:putative colanic acid biosynthesis UDP-glucose lipid carrier transferase
MLKQRLNSYMLRHVIKPGITGWAQVNGWRGPTETRLQYSARTLHDLWYIEHWTFGLDIYIIFLTVFGKKARINAF